MSTLGDGISEPPVKLIVGVLTATPDQTDRIYSQLVAQFGQIDFRSQWLPFENTDYYHSEIGEHLHRQFLSFRPLIDPGWLADIKLFTNTAERRFSENGQRCFNLDPGYVTPSKLVLATTKNFAHRVYLHSGIFAEITLRYHQNLLLFDLVMASRNSSHMRATANLYHCTLVSYAADSLARE